MVGEVIGATGGLDYRGQSGLTCSGAQGDSNTSALSGPGLYSQLASQGTAIGTSQTIRERRLAQDMSEAGYAIRFALPPGPVCKA